MTREKKITTGASIEYERVIGAKVRVCSLSLQNGWSWKEDGKKLYTVESVGFRIGIDGKCFTILTLAEFPDRRFTLADVEFVEYGEIS